MAVELMTEMASVVVPAAMVGLFAAILAYYLAKLLSLKDLEKVWALEVTESVVSVLLLVVLFVIILPYLLDALQEYVETLYGGQLPTINTQLGALLDQTPAYIVLYRLEASQKVLEEVRKISLTFKAMAKQGKVSYTVGNTPKIGLGFTIVKALNDNLYNNVLNLLYLFLLMKKVFLVMPLVAEIVIPVGIAFRAFPPTRGMGAYLLSFGLVFAYLFPMFLLALMGPEPPEEYKQIMESKILKAPMRAVEKMVESFRSLSGVPFLGEATSLLFLSPKIAAWSTLAIGFSSALVYGEQTVHLIFSLNHLMGVAVVDLLFAPFAAFGISLSLVNIFTTLLGGRIPEIGRGLAKFI